MKRLWIITTVLLAVTLTLAVNANPTKAQETQEPSENGYKDVRRMELKAQRVETGQREQGAPGILEENKLQGMEEREQKQQTTEEKGEKTQEKQHIDEAKEGDKQQTQRTVEEETEQSRKKGEEQQQINDEQGEETQQPHQKEEKQRAEKRKQYRFLFGYPIAPRSSSVFFGGIISALLDAGHHVTLVAPHNIFETSDQVRTVVVKEGDPTPFIAEPFNEHRLKGISTVAAMSPKVCTNILARPDVQELLKEEFDMVFISMFICDCFLSVVHQMKYGG